MGLGDDSRMEAGSVMQDGGGGEADNAIERQTCLIGRWSRVQLKPGLKSESCPCVTPGKLAKPL